MAKGAKKTEVNTFLFGTFKAECTDGLFDSSSCRACRAFKSVPGLGASLLKLFMDLHSLRWAGYQMSST